MEKRRVEILAKQIDYRVLRMRFVLTTCFLFLAVAPNVRGVQTDRVKKFCDLRTRSYDEQVVEHFPDRDSIGIAKYGFDTPTPSKFEATQVRGDIRKFLAHLEPKILEGIRMVGSEELPSKFRLLAEHRSSALCEHVLLSYAVNGISSPLHIVVDTTTFELRPLSWISEDELTAAISWATSACPQNEMSTPLCKAVLLVSLVYGSGQNYPVESFDDLLASLWYSSEHLNPANPEGVFSDLIYSVPDYTSDDLATSILSSNDQAGRDIILETSMNAAVRGFAFTPAREFSTGLGGDSVSFCLYSSECHELAKWFVIFNSDGKVKRIGYQSEPVAIGSESPYELSPYNNGWRLKVFD